MVHNIPGNLADNAGNFYIAFVKIAPPKGGEIGQHWRKANKAGNFYIAVVKFVPPTGGGERATFTGSQPGQHQAGGRKPLPQP